MLVPLRPTGKYVGIVVPQAKFVVMGTTAQPLVLVCMTPVVVATIRIVTTVAVVMVVKARMASLVVRLVASLVQGVP